MVTARVVEFDKTKIKRRKPLIRYPCRTATLKPKECTQALRGGYRIYGLHCMYSVCIESDYVIVSAAT